MNLICSHKASLAEGTLLLCIDLNPYVPPGLEMIWWDNEDRIEAWSEEMQRGKTTWKKPHEIFCYALVFIFLNGRKYLCF